jgi:hypothetical protein
VGSVLLALDAVLGLYRNYVWTTKRESCGFRTMPISIPGHADHPFRDDGDHDSGRMPITCSGVIPIS